MDKHENDGLYGLAVIGDQVIAMGDRDYVIKTANAWDDCEAKPSCNDCSCLFEVRYLNTHYKLEDVFFADEQNGWTVGSQSFSPALWGQVILHTGDGGETWETQYEHAPPDTLFSVHRLNSVYFTDSQTGWAVGKAESYIHEETRYQGAMLHTGDGGQTWQEAGSELYEGRDREFFAVDFLMSQNGWALVTRLTPSHNIHLAHTLDGGATWAWVDTGIEGPLAIGFAEVQGDVTFIDEQNGWAVGGMGQVAHTADGGQTWSRQTLSCESANCTNALYAVEMLDTQTGWMAGQGVFYTTDGGMDWVEQDLGLKYRLQDVQFIDAQNGWLVGERGIVMYTTDGGIQWTHVESSEAVTLRGLHFVSPQQGWIVGDYGVILEYAAGQ